MTESLLGDTERRDEVVVEGLSSLWKDEDDSLRFRERSRAISRLVLLMLSPFDSLPRSAVPPGGESSPLLILGGWAFGFGIVTCADIGVVGAERGLIGRCWAIIGSDCGETVGFETLTVLTLMSCCLMAFAPSLWN